MSNDDSSIRYTDAIDSSGNTSDCVGNDDCLWK